MRREGTPYEACKKKICEIWNVLNELRGRVSNAYTRLNGQQADGSNNLQISGSEGITVETRSGNEIRLIGVAAEPYTGQAPIVIDPGTKTVSINMDGAPVSGSGNAVTSGGIYAANQTLQNNIDQETAARTAGVQSLHNEIQTERSARLSDVTTLTRQVSTEETRRQNADTALQAFIDNLADDLDTEAVARSTADAALGNRIDNVINGTTPPSTISGVLPIQNGGTGSSTQNFVDIGGHQIITGHKIFSDPVYDVIVQIQNPNVRLGESVDSIGHGYAIVDSQGYSMAEMKRFVVDTAGNGPTRTRTYAANGDYIEVDIWVMTDGHSYLTLNQNHNGVITGHTIYQFRGYKMHILMVIGEGKGKIMIWHRYPCEGNENDLLDQMSAYYSSPITRNPVYKDWKIRLVEGDVTDSHEIVVKSVIWEHAIEN